MAILGSKMLRLPRFFAEFFVFYLIAPSHSQQKEVNPAAAPPLHEEVEPHSESKTPTEGDPLVGPSPKPIRNPGCKSVAFIGDSTSTGMMKSSYIPDPGQRLDAQFARVGIEISHIEVKGGRSMVEHRKGNENGVMVARRLRDSGFKGCWIIALGTNDAANFAAGSPTSPAKRVSRMMGIIGDDPVIWVDVITIKKTGHWNLRNMHAWNQALEGALSSYKNAKIYKWSEVVARDWWAKDGIHYNSKGYSARAELVAEALDDGF